MKITIFKNQENFITRDYDLSVASVVELERVLIEHCALCDIAPLEAAVLIPAGELEPSELIVKGTSNVMSMNEVAEEILKLIDRDRYEAKVQSVKTRTIKRKTNFANGFDFFCTECAKFYSISHGDTLIDISQQPFNDPVYCPFCGEQEPYSSVEGILDYCDENDIDPVIFYKIFPQDELIPQSSTGATPLQVSIILDLFTIRRHKGLPITAELIAGDEEVQREVVRKVFKELHITETIGEEK